MINNRYYLTFFASLVLVILMNSCTQSKSSETSVFEKVNWDVTIYDAVPLDSMNMALTVIPEKLYGVLPLRYNYSQEEIDMVEELFALNDSVMQARGYKYQWVKENGGAFLAIFFAKPIFSQKRVKIIKISECQEGANYAQVCFEFEDKEGWRALTASRLGRAVAIAVNGVVFMMPICQAPIESGVASVLLRYEDFSDFLPNVEIRDIEESGN